MYFPQFHRVRKNARTKSLLHLTCDLLQILLQDRCMILHRACQVHSTIAYTQAKSACDAHTWRVDLTVMSQGECLRYQRATNIAFITAFRGHQQNINVSQRELTYGCNIQRFKSVAKWKYLPCCTQG